MAQGERDTDKALLWLIGLFTVAVLGLGFFIGWMVFA